MTRWICTPSQPRVTRPFSLSWGNSALAMLIGIAKPMFWPRSGLTIAVLMPITRPFTSISGPPELPGLMLASVCITSPAPTSSSTADSPKNSDRNRTTNRKETRSCPEHPSSSSTASGSTRPPGRPGSTCSPSAATTPSAPGWPGDADTVAETRAAADALDDVGIEQICHHYADYIDTLDAKPIVIGHSFGGLIAQELLANDLAIAAVAIDPAPIKGVKALPFSQLRSGFPVLGNPANKKRTVSLTAKQFRYSFGNAITEEESDALFEAWTIPGPGRPLFEDATANFSRNSPAKVDTHHAVARTAAAHLGQRGPHRAEGGHPRGRQDVRGQNPRSVTEYHEFEGRGHSLTIDAGWRDVADATLEWLASQKLEADVPASATPV